MSKAEEVFQQFLYKNQELEKRVREIGIAGVVLEAERRAVAEYKQSQKKRPTKATPNKKEAK